MSETEEKSNDKIPKVEKKYDKAYSHILIWSIMVSFFSIAWNFRALAINSCLESYFKISSTIEHYRLNPLSDLSYTIPIFYDSELQFPDLPEAANIQIKGRLEKEASLVDVSFSFTNTEVQSFDYPDYPQDVLFLNMHISDNNALYISDVHSYCELYYNIETVNSNDLPYFVTQLLVDSAFKDELEFYYPGSLYLNNTSNNTHFLTNNQMHNSIVQNFLQDGIQTLNVSFYFIGTESYSIDLNSLEHDIKSQFDPLSKIIELNFEMNQLPYKSNCSYLYKEEIENVPYELTDFHYMSEILQKQQNNSLIFLFYPYEQLGVLGKVRNVKETLLYQDENSLIDLPHGMLYLTNIPTLDLSDETEEEENIFRAFSKGSLSEFEERVSKKIMDKLFCFPQNLEVGVSLRIKSWQRILLVDLLTYWSSLLVKLELELQNIKSTNLWNDKIELFEKSLKLREEAVKLAGADQSNIELALEKAQEAIHVLIT